MLSTTIQLDKKYRTHTTSYQHCSLSLEKNEMTTGLLREILQFENRREGLCRSACYPKECVRGNRPADLDEIQDGWGSLVIDNPRSTRPERDMQTLYGAEE